MKNDSKQDISRRRLSPWAGYVGPAMVWLPYLAVKMPGFVWFLERHMDGGCGALMALGISLLGVLFCLVNLLCALVSLLCALWRSAALYPPQATERKHVLRRRMHRRIAAGGVILSAFTLIIVAIWLA
jgi:hypothetical protein